ncbi:MAG: DUF4111 domain-containing protein [Phycisphaeraceae bacterium]
MAHQPASHDPHGLRSVLDHLVTLARETLADNLLGVYLQGSQATSGFDDASDIDFIIATHHDLTDTTVDQLQLRHQHLHANHPSYWARHLEGSYIPRHHLTTLPPPRQQLWYLDHGHTIFERSDHDHYLAVLWILRERAVVLAGPHPNTLIPEIPADALRHEIRTTMHDWAHTILTNPNEMTQRWYAAFAVLSYARMALSLTTGEIHSKKQGVTWARQTFSTRWHPLINHALQTRHDLNHLLEPETPETLEQTKAYIRDVLERDA